MNSFAFRCIQCEITLDRPFGTCDTCAKILDQTYVPSKSICTLYVLQDNAWIKVYKDDKSEVIKIASRMTDTYKVVNNFGDIIAIGESDEKG
tara:strand:+ start:26 stop:301 length:276 start_codon:yes stop_codon:yes gene_type:complete